MAIPIKTQEEIKKMREGGHILAQILENVMEMAAPGVSTLELNQFAEKLIRKKNGKPTFKGYHGFPAALCTCRNEIIVHGIPKKDDILQEGDIFTIDCGVTYKGMITDAARSKIIGKGSPQKENLLRTAFEVLEIATNLIKPNIHLNEIGKTIEKHVNKAGFHIIHDLTGHGVGKKLHEEPLITNFWEGKPGPRLSPGMTLAIEPIFSAGTSKMKTLPDGWTLITTDNSPAVQVENTILVTDQGSEVLTR